MAYLLLVFEDSGSVRPSAEEGRVRYERMMDFAESLSRRGVLRAAESLAPASDGARVRKRAGAARVVDGPFAEAKEIVGGFFLLDVATREEALVLASECPAAEWSTVEVRPVARCWDADA